jgi:hypothetical protein
MDARDVVEEFAKIANSTVADFPTKRRRACRRNAGAAGQRRADLRIAD